MRPFRNRLLAAAARLLGPAAAALLWLLGAALPAHAATYSFRSDSYAWESASTQVSWDASCTQYPGDDDKATLNFTGGFKFRFAGIDYASVRVLANGMLQFGTDTGLFRDYTNDAMPIGSAPARGGCAAGPATNVLAAYWTDLDPSRSGGGKVYWQQKGTAPNRYVVVSWSGVYQYSTTKPYTFQVVLYENGEFKYQYGSGNTTGLNATIGVQVSAGDYTQYAYNNGYTAAGTAIRWYIPSTEPAKVAEYRMDETSWNGTVGEVLDSSGQSHNGVRVGNSSQTTPAGQGYVCRAFEVPPNTSTGIAAVDTALDVDSAIGPATGSVSLWYRANVRWSNNGNAAMLVDATTLAARPFYLQRNDRGALRFMVSDFAGNTLVATSAAQNFAADTWVHVAATWSLAPGSNKSTLRIYVNGSQAASTTGTTLGSLDVSLGTLFVGDNRSTSTPSGATDNSANGRIDEVRIYNYDTSAAEIAADMAATHGCGSALHHLEIQGDASGLTCTPSSFTIVACQDAACSTRYAEGVTGSFTASGAASWPDGSTINIPAGSSSVDLRLQLTTPGSVMLGASALVPAPSDGVSCNLDGSSSCAYSAADSGFVFDVPDHRAEAAQSVAVSAVKKSDTGTACVPAFAGVTKLVPFACAYSNPASGTLPVRMGGSALACDGVRRNVSLNFDASGVATTTVQYADVGQVALDARYVGSGADAGLVMTGSDSFVAAPAALQLSNPAPATPRAGSNFALTLTARNSAGNPTPNFGQEAVAVLALDRLRRAPTGAGASDGAFSGSVPGYSGGSGVASLVWSEVGWIDIEARVDNYLGSGLSTVASTSGAPAAFHVLPHHFDVALASAGHGCGSFTYAGLGAAAGQSFRVDITARNAANATTTNYDGSLGNPVSRNFTLAETSALGGTLSAGPHAAAAVFRAGLANNVAAWYAFAAKETAPSTLMLGGADTDGASTADKTPPVLASVALRSGRLRLSNAFGSEKSALQLAVTAETWSGSAWQLSAQDSCTSFAAGAVVRANLRDRKGAAAAWATSAGGVALAGGRGLLVLSAPAPAGTGSVDVAVNLGATTSDSSCLVESPPVASVGAALPWLRSRNGGGGACAGAPWDRDPSARATFGVYSPESQRTVHAREIF